MVSALPKVAFCVTIKFCSHAGIQMSEDVQYGLLLFGEQQAFAFAGETEEETDSPAKDEPHEEEEQEEVVTNLYFGSDYLDAMENEQMFLLFVNRQNIYIFSKKCLSEEEQNKLREIFTEKSIL